MAKINRELYKYAGIFLLFCLTILFLVRAERIDRYKSAIPEKIKIDRTVLVGQEGTPWIFVLFPSVVRASSCGGAIFKMSQSTVDALEAQRLSFFEDATRARGKYGEKESEEKESERNKPGYLWKKTPVPDTWTSDGAWIGLACIGTNGNNDKLIRKITKAAELPGSYYVGTNKSNFTILVLPKLGLVVHDRYNL